jgi:hypothetical protein
MTQKMSANFQRDEGRGTRDGKKWEGEAPAEPKRRRVANGEWRIVNGFDHPPEVDGYEFKAG